MHHETYCMVASRLGDGTRRGHVNLKGAVRQIGPSIPKFNLLINLITTKALGLTTLLAAAAEVIE